MQTLLRVAISVDYVAQQVEHIPFKDGVLGSSPSVVTKESTISDKGKRRFIDYVAQQVEHIPFKDGVLGSSPSVVTSRQKTADKDVRRFFMEITMK